MSQQAVQYQQVQERAALQQEAQRYQQQLENQGYMAEQAQQITHQYMQSRQAQANTAKQHQFQTQMMLGKQAAAEHFAKTHNLGFDAMATLRLADTPEQMEVIAKKMSCDAKNMDELAKLRQAQVPAQQFDSSQGEPQVASNDGSWLDRYNAGDRSANATAAARRLMGI
jgi:predicted O-linked N-acetylglucosamine transferase (SPINDLY family)